ncbi:MAG: AAA family ATPase [Cellulosilyticaceae bacterium]
MALSKKWKKPEQIIQALKICIYGENGCGKSLVGLMFPQVAVIDSEAKVGTYVDDPIKGVNIIGVADTSDYYDCIEITKEIVEDKTKPCETLLIDSETKVYDALSVSCMEVEEKRAEKNKKDVTDQVVSQRGYGKIKLNAARLSALKAAASSKGITVVVTAHIEDVMSGTGENRVKVGERPALRKKAEHDYDCIIKVGREKDLATGKFKFIATIEKDTTNSFKLGEKVDYTWVDEHTPNTVIYDRLKHKIEKTSVGTRGESSYAGAVDGAIEKGSAEAKSADDIINEFAELFKSLKDIGDNKAAIQKLLADNEVKSYKDHATVDKLQIVVAAMKELPTA